LQLESFEKMQICQNVQKNFKKRKFETETTSHDTRLNKLHQIKDGEKDFFLQRKDLH